MISGPGEQPEEEGARPDSGEEWSGAAAARAEEQHKVGGASAVNAEGAGPFWRRRGALL